jgi:hypothetical protein
MWDLRFSQRWLYNLLHAGFLLGLFFDPEDRTETSVDYERVTRRYILQFRVLLISSLRNQDSSVGIATGCGLNGRVSVPNMGKRLFSSP